MGRPLNVSLLLALSVTTSVLASEGSSTSRARFIGLVEVPGVFGARAPDAPVPVPPEDPPALALRARPSMSAKVVFTVRSATELAADEHGYEHRSARVFDVASGWYLVEGIRDKTRVRGWLAPSDCERFRPYEELVDHSLAFLTTAWDGRLRVLPSDGAKLVPHERQARRRVEIAASELRGREHDELWFLVVVMGEGKCGDPLPVVAAGWVPAWSGSGARTVWFHSRGC